MEENKFEKEAKMYWPEEEEKEINWPTVIISVSIIIGFLIGIGIIL